jgi:hypothetical protein
MDWMQSWLSRSTGLDDCAQSSRHAVTCNPDSTHYGLSRSHCMRECRPLPCSRMPDFGGFDPATEKRVLLFEPIQRRVQTRDYGLRLICDHDQFDVDLLVLHLCLPNL